MAANAPYYQMRGQFTAPANTSLAFPPPDDDHYGLAAPLPMPPLHAPQEPPPPPPPLCADLPAPPDHHHALAHALARAHTHGVPEESHSLAELLEAATTAAGHAAAAMSLAPRPPPHPHPPAAGKRKRDDGDSAPASPTAASPAHKRARTDVAAAPAEFAEPAAPAAPAEPTPPAEPQGRPRAATDSDTRAAGVHSAAALFRRSAKEPARKYTRPPMSKLFMSLQLTPENFLHLQALAKAYMLDPAHPDRQSCVGSRGKGDTDMVKLKLFNCVHEFLSAAVGEQFFGANVEKPAARDAIEAARALGEETTATDAKLVWPRDGNKIISLVTPLLRRMVTNERQRMYAIETRKGGKRKEDSAEPAVDAVDAPLHVVDGVHVSDRSQEPPPAFHPMQQSQPPTPAPTLPAHHSHSHSPSASASAYHNTCAHFSPPPPAHSITNLTEDADTELSVSAFKAKERNLPTAEDRVFELRKISIVVAKDGLRLKQKDHIIGPGPLVEYSWEHLQQRILLQLKLALATYPQLRPVSSRPVGQQQPQEHVQTMAPEALRGLAVAATEIEHHSTRSSNLTPELRIDSVSRPTPTAFQYSPLHHEPPPSGSIICRSLDAANEGAAHQTTQTAVSSSFPPSPIDPAPTQSNEFPPATSAQQPPANEDQLRDKTSSPAAQPSSVLPTGSSDPGLRYAVKAILTTGLSEIKTAEDWENAKLDIGYAVWANGKLSVVVELL